MRRDFYSMRLTGEERRMVDKLSEEWGCTKSEVIRWAFRFFLVMCKDRVSFLRFVEEMESKSGEAPSGK